MGIFLKPEFKTEVEGDGDGFIKIAQTLEDGEQSVIWLSVHQFETIFNHEKFIIREALGTE